MGNSFVFSRPRGIKGNYTVVIRLELLPTEQAIVSALQSSPQIGKSTNKPALQRVRAAKCEETNGWRVVKYVIGRIVAGDTIVVDIQGAGRDPLRRVVCNATMQSFAVRKASWHTDINTYLADRSDFVLRDADTETYVSTNAECCLEETGFPTIELRVLDVRGGFQISRLVETGVSSESDSQKLLEEMQALRAPRLPVGLLAAIKEAP